MTDIRPLTLDAELDELRRLGVEAGLEPSEDREEVMVAAWGAFEGDELVGGIAFETLGGLDLVGWLVVAEHLRGRGVGRRLLAALEDEARRLGVEEIWATARAPGFFTANGFSTVAGGSEFELLLSGCFACDQHRVRCHPEVVKKTLQASST